METTDLLNLVVQTLEDNKAEEIVSLDVHDLTTVTDWMVISSANSKRHAHALGDHVVTKVKSQGLQPLGVEGENQNEWLLVDLGSIVIHIMLPEIRKFYSLEKLWNVTLKAREEGD
ncbi:MAG: ribosome silencing factor [Gammaproteobacteria bacterium]|nr:ribosome silencing factor [Gammaproteobacteria bacterium]